MARDLIIACDFKSKEETLSFLEKFGELRPFVKIGMELFYSEGPEIVRELKARGHKVFLDLKLCDIPNTVGSAMKALKELRVDLCNVHAFGGLKMMRAAAENFGSGGIGKLVAVTILTSLSEKELGDEMLVSGKLDDVILSYAENAKRAGLHGVVCSPLEAKKIHELCGEDFITITPGIRDADSASDDQKRKASPSEAGALGSDYIVVGRPITRAENPKEKYISMYTEFMGRSLELSAAFEVARALLKIGAVFLKPDDPFIWASGIKSPIYCDNRLILSEPCVRELVESELAKIVSAKYPDCESLMGTSTAGIAHAAIVAQKLDLPMGYVRASKKDHGRENLIEGKLNVGQKVVIVEDLISTGGSVINVLNTLREAGADVLGIVSIFTYGMKKASERLKDAGIENTSLSNFESVCKAAALDGIIKENDLKRLMSFIENPNDEGWLRK